MSGNDAFTKLLIHSNNLDGNTDFVDSSASGHALTVRGNTHHDTAQKVLGTNSSIRLDGNGDDLHVGPHDDFDMGTGALTIDVWYRPTSKVTSYPRVWQLGEGWGGQELTLLDRHNSIPTKFAVQSGNGSTPVQSSTAVVDGQWYHLEVGIKDGVIYLFIDGVLEDSANFTRTVNSDTRTFTVGSSYTETTTYGNGNWSELRVSKGICRHTTNFTPETTSYVGGGTKLLSFAHMLYGNLTATHLAKSSMPYVINNDFLAVVAMFYGIRLSNKTLMQYDNAPTLQRLLNQYYGDCPQLQNISQMSYDDLAQISKSLDMPYTIPYPLLAILEARYGLSGESVRAILNQQYNLLDVHLIKSKTDMMYLLQEESQINQIDSVVLVNGVVVHPHHINLEYTIDSYVASAEIHLSIEAEYLAISRGDDLQITLSGTDHIFIVESEPRRSRSGSGTNYIVSAVSPAIKLSVPWCDTFTCVFEADTASNIFEALAHPIPVFWDVVDFPVLANTLYANDEDKISVMRKLTQSVGAIIQSQPDGSLRVIYRYPVAVNLWSETPADYYLTDERNFISQDETYKHNDGYNRYTVANTSAAGESVSLEADYPYLRAVEVPWSGKDMSVIHSGGSVVPVIISNGQQDIVYPPVDEDAELVEFVAGFARLQKPWYGTISFEWLREPLGAITYSEDGTIEAESKTGSTDGYSLAKIRYTTRYNEWIVDNGEDKSLQYLLVMEGDDAKNSGESCS